MGTRDLKRWAPRPARERRSYARTTLNRGVCTYVELDYSPNSHNYSPRGVTSCATATGAEPPTPDLARTYREEPRHARRPLGLNPRYPDQTATHRKEHAMRDGHWG
jgi:hypothetical protein